MDPPLCVKLTPVKLNNLPLWGGDCFSPEFRCKNCLFERGGSAIFKQTIFCLDIKARCGHVCTSRAAAGRCRWMFDFAK